MSEQQAQDQVDAPASSLPAGTQSLPDRAMDPAAGGETHLAGEISKNAAKKAAKKEKQAAEKAEKSANKGIGKEESKKKPSQKAPKKKPDGPALIGIDVSKEEDFSGWYQQVLLKGQMLDYYDVSGCFILKVFSFSCSFYQINSVDLHI